MGDKEYGLDAGADRRGRREIVEVQQQGVELAIVVGAGNIYRGMAAAARGNGPGDRRLRGDARDRC